MTGNKSVVSWKLKFVGSREGGLTWLGEKGTFWNDRNVLYLHFGGGFMGE